MFIYFFLFALNIITILFKITNQKDIYSLTSNNKTLLNFLENNNNNDIQLLENPYKYLEMLITFIKADPKYFAKLLINNELNPIIQKLIGKEEYLNLIMDIEKIIINDEQTKKLIIELFDDIAQNKSSLDYILLLNEANGFKEIFSISYDFIRYHRNILKKIVEIFKKFPLILKDTLSKFTKDNQILIEQSFPKKFRYLHYEEFLSSSEIYNFFEKADKKDSLKSPSNIDIDILNELFGLYITENYKALFEKICEILIKTVNLKYFVYNILRYILNLYSLWKEDEIENGMSLGCFKLLKYTLLGKIDDDTMKKYNITDEPKESLSNYYLHKLIYDSTKNKNDILKYDDCIRSDISDDIIRNNPTFLTYLIDETYNKKWLRNGTYFENFYFISGICLLQGIKKEEDLNDNETEYYCNETDYNYVMKMISKIIARVDDEEKIILVELKKDKNSWKNLYYLIPFFIFLIPILIYFFLKLYNMIIIRRKKKVLITNQARNSKFANGDNDVDVKNNEREINKLKIIPKWYNILRDFFNIENNYKELFDFDSEETRNYNTSGLVYIKGLMGISIILIIMGQLYLIFFNLPMKEFGQYQFYSLINNILYIFPFIGLRYSPRIIFSCSGFMLAYKFLTYLNRGRFYHLFKFIFRQLYKYLILINLIFFAKFSLNVLISNFFEITPMIKIFNTIILTNIEFSLESILNLFTIKSYFIDKRDNIYHNLMDYYWIAFNEIFFFIFGTFLISIGYKCKLRFDFFIIFLALSLYIGKIIFYYFIKRKETYFYTTLYYYLFDFGIIMTNPLFNLSYFLIGMYFGLINYSIQKGIIDINENSKIFNKIHNDKTKNRINYEINELDLLSNKESYNNARFSSNFNDDEDKDKIFDDIKTDGKIRKKNHIINKYINDLFTNSFDNNDLNSINNKIIGKNNEQNIMEEFKEMPFLKSSIIIIKWHRNHQIFFFFIILISLISLLILSFIFITYLFLYLYERNIKNSNEENNISKKLSLVDFITNPILNYIYLIDTEIFVFLVHWLFFILFMKRQYFFINFFSHNFWSYFMKSYFSFLMISNLVILYNFYNSETVIKLNLYNLFLFYFINSVIISILTNIFYITIELPLKKIFKYLVKKEDYIIDNNKERGEKGNEEEEDEDEEKDDENEEEESESNLYHINEENKII